MVPRWPPTTSPSPNWGFHMPPRYSNGHISATAHSIHLYGAHRVVIFAIAHLFCYPYCFRCVITPLTIVIDNIHKWMQCTVSQKHATRHSFITSTIVRRFSTFFTVWLNRKLVNSCHNIFSSHSKCVSALPCETWMFKLSFSVVTNDVQLGVNGPDNSWSRCESQLHTSITCWLRSYCTWYLWRVRFLPSWRSTSTPSMRDSERRETFTWFCQVYNTCMIQTVQIWLIKIVREAQQRGFYKREVNDVNERLIDVRDDLEHCVINISMMTGTTFTMRVFVPNEDIFSIWWDLFRTLAH